MKLIIHIGTEKTGTSSIQNTLFRNKTLLESQGYFFSQCAGKQNNFKFPLYCMDKPTYNVEIGETGFDDKDFLKNRISSADFKNHGIDSIEAEAIFKDTLERDLEKEILNLDENIHTFIVSSEHFHSLLVSVSEVQKLKALMSKYFNSIKVICYLREQVKTCISHYSTIIKSGFAPEFDKFMQLCSINNPYYNYLDMLNRWSTVFGQENLVLGIFDKSKLLNGNVVEDFLEKIGIDTVKITVQMPKNINISLNYTGQCLLKQLNRLDIKEVSLKNRVSQFVHQTFSGNGETVSPALYLALYTSFAKMNSTINRVYFDSSEDLFLFSPPSNVFDKGSEFEIVVRIMPVIEFMLNEAPHIDDCYADICRDIAVENEKKSKETAFQLMTLAGLIRPNGPFIRKKINDYKIELKRS